MPIVTSAIDDRHFICELPAEPYDFKPGDNRSKLAIFALGATTQSKPTIPLPNSIQERALHAINSVWAKLLKVS
jgi:hypothetical protein